MTFKLTTYLSVSLKIALVILVAFLNTSKTLAQTQQESYNQIQGKVTYLGEPLPNVNIIVKGTSQGTKTASDGTYSIRARVGDHLIFSHVGFDSISIIVEDITSVLNIEMDAYVDKLEEVEITARKKNVAVTELESALNVEIETSFGIINPMASGAMLHYLDNQSLRRIASPSLEDALNGRFSQVEKRGDKLYIRSSVAKYDIDGQFYETPPALTFSNIEHLYLLKDRALIVIRTKNAPEAIKKRREAIAEKHRNQNYYSNDAIPFGEDANNTITQSSNLTEPREIKGKITFLGAPIPDVNVVVKETTKGTKTNTEGYYSIKVKVGSVLKYTHVGFKTVHIVVEDVTSILNVEMIQQVNELDETVVTVNNKEGSVLDRFKKRNEKFTTAMGVFDPKTSGLSIGYIDGKEIQPHYPSLSEALLGKISGLVKDPITKKFIIKPSMSINSVPPPLWDVDGVISQEEPLINLNDIKDIHILKTTNRYGSLGAGGVIVVRTRSATFSGAERRNIAENYKNKNKYGQDALRLNDNEYSTNQYTNTLREINNEDKAFTYYQESLKSRIENYNMHLSIAQNFITIYDAQNYARQIFKNQVVEHNNHPERLKAIAYQLQQLNFKKDAVELYETIFKLRSNYAQSYRDLANAYRANDQYRKAWRLYMSYLLQGHDVSDEGIGQILYNEMEYLYYNRKNQANITQQFIPKNENIKAFRNDVRLVVEWNTSEAEFDLEFVSPDKRAYVFEHSLEANQDLITNEKEKGYSSKEFSVEAIGEGDWLINLTYKGNKKPEPTYFKITTFFNWGKPHQKEDIKVFELQDQRDKLQLIRLNKEQLQKLE